MRNRERAKEYMKNLYSALGYQWQESYFSNRWTSNLYGQDWDKLFELGLVKNDFCALCGNDELRSGYYRMPAFSKYKIKLPVCDECWNELGIDKHLEGLQEAKKEINSKIKSGCFIVTVIIAVILYLIFK